MNINLVLNKYYVHTAAILRNIEMRKCFSSPKKAFAHRSSNLDVEFTEISQRFVALNRKLQTDAQHLLKNLYNSITYSRFSVIY